MIWDLKEFTPSDWCWTLTTPLIIRTCVDLVPKCIIGHWQLSNVFTAVELDEFQFCFFWEEK